MTFKLEAIAYVLLVIFMLKIAAGVKHFVVIQKTLFFFMKNE